MTATGVLSCVRQKYKYPAGCVWSRQGSEAKHPSGSKVTSECHKPEVLALHLYGECTQGHQPVLIPGFCQWKTLNCMFENHCMLPLTLGHGKDCAAAGGRVGAEGARVVFHPQGFFVQVVHWKPLTVSLCLSALSIALLSQQHMAITRAAPRCCTPLALAGIKSGSKGDWKRGNHLPKQAGEPLVSASLKGCLVSV